MADIILFGALLISLGAWIGWPPGAPVLQYSNHQ